MKILITAAASAQAYQLERFLGKTEDAVFADSQELPKIMLKGRKFIKISAGDSFSFSHELLTACLDLQITTIYPLRKNEILALAEARQLFDEYNIKVIVPETANISSLFNKGIKGEILVCKEESDSPVNQRGVFLINTDQDFQLFTAD